MGSVPGTNSCPFADVATVVPSQAAACDTGTKIQKVTKADFEHHWDFLMFSTFDRFIHSFFRQVLLSINSQTSTEWMDIF